jgi:glutamate 5-kinase
MQTRQQITAAKRWVVKIGSALLTNEGRGLAKESIGHWVDQLAELRRNGCEIVLVSSGSVAEGMTRLGWYKRPHALHELQAAAAVGQMGLVQAYESHFQRHGLHTAQILLTHEDLADRQRYLNARSTLRSLLALGVIPVINENDTVATDEIRFGDNDTLAALVANFCEADLMVILTDQQGLFDKDPRQHADAKLISVGQAGDPALEAIAGGAGKFGMGGMLTKVRAAARAARSGAATVIASGSEPEILLRLGRGEDLGTLLLSDDEPLLARKQWLAGQLKVKGKLFIDQGAVRVLCEQGRSLLPVGLTAVDGQFRRGELVACIGPDGSEVARGLVNYNVDESRRLIGKSTDQIESILGYVDESELIHRDDMVITAGERLKIKGQRDKG